MRERRAFPRWTVPFRFTAHNKSETFPGVITDISEHGPRVAAKQPVAVGDELNITWNIDSDASPFEVRCVVRNIGEGQVGVEFLNVGLTDRLRIVDLFRSLDVGMKLS